MSCQDDEEWDDYRENKKDFTGLKIDKLVIEEPVINPEEEETEVSLGHDLNNNDVPDIEERVLTEVSLAGE